MKVFIFMTDRIRQRKPKGPVIRVQGSGHSNPKHNFRDGNTLVINGPCIVRFDPRGCPFAPDHHVTAWIEADEQDVSIR